MTNQFDILYLDEHLVVIDKPANYHVHPHETADHRVSRSMTCLYVLRDQIQKKLFPVHRLDAATSGVLVFALTSEVASLLSKQIRNGEWKKTYHAVVRGYVKDSELIEKPLELDSTGELVPAQTRYHKLSQIELDHAIGKRFSTARYSLVEVEPVTGRYHQIRRHFNRIAHPLLGDHNHGDTHHNRFFRETLKIEGLCLRATRLEFSHPMSGQYMEIKINKIQRKWKKIEELFSHEIIF